MNCFVFVLGRQESQKAKVRTKETKKVAAEKEVKSKYRVSIIL